MRIFILILLLSLSTLSKGQDWVNYQLDSNLTVTIPSNFQMKDTLGQGFITAFDGPGYIVITKIVNKEKLNGNITNEKQLIEAYNDFQKGFIDSSNCKLLNEQVIDKQGLKLKRFDYEFPVRDSKQIRYNLVLFVNKTWYAISYSQFTTILIERNPSYEKLFSFVQINPTLSIKNQMTSSWDPDAIAYNIGRATGFVLIIALFISIIIGISKLINRITKKPIDNSSF
jgi:hypothetical protein